MEAEIASYLGDICEELHKLNENIKAFEGTFEEKFGGFGFDSLNCTLYTDKPIMVKQADTEEKKEEKKGKE